MSITFDSIPLNIRTPGQFIEFNNSRAAGQSSVKPHKILLIGQRMSAGTVPQLVPSLINADTSGDAFFGVRSQLAAMCRAAKAANPYTEMWACALDDNGSGVARVQTLTVTGPATAQGTLSLYINGKLIQVPVANGDSAATIAASINTAIQTSTYYPKLPLTSGVASAVVTLTYSNKGTVANDCDVRLNYLPGDATPAGVTVTIAQSVAGSVDPVLQNVLDILGDVQYDSIGIAFGDATSLTALSAFLQTRVGPMIQKEGMGYFSYKGTQSTLTTKGNALNSPWLCLIEGGGLVANSPSPSYERAAVGTAVCAFEAVNDPARPLQQVVLTGILPPGNTDRFTQDERNVMLSDGIATTFVDAAGNVLIERMITTYQANPLGIPDVSYLDSETPRTLFQLRYEVRSLIGLKYPRHKLADDGTLFDPGQAIVTPSSIRADLIGLFTRWESRGLVENFIQFQQDLIVQRSTTDVNRVDMKMGPNLINQFRVFAGQIQFLL